MKRFVAALMLAGGLLVAGGANAAATVTFTETGGNVVVTFSGSINTAALTPMPSNGYAPIIWPGIALVNIGDSGGTICSEYSGINGPTSWGNGFLTQTSSVTGDKVVIYGGTGHPTGQICLPPGYTGGALNGTSTYNGTTLAALQLTVNTYTYTWGSGATADSINLYIGTPPSSPNNYHKRCFLNHNNWRNA